MIIHIGILKNKGGVKMYYKLKKYERGYSVAILAALGSDEFNIGRMFSELRDNEEYNNFDIFICAYIHHSIRRYFLRRLEPQYFETCIIAILDEKQKTNPYITDSKLFALVKHAFILAYGKDWYQIMKEYEEGII